MTTPRRCLDARLTREVETAVLAVMDRMEALVRLRIGVRDGSGRIRGAVVHDDGLPVLELLGLETLEAALEIGGHVVGRDDHGDSGHCPSKGLRTCRNILEP